ncbi:MAG: Ku protein [Methylocystaceae bacterium]
MKSIWKGAVSFGLVNIPVSMYVATENKDIKFNYLHRECMGPIKYQKFCPRCSREVTSEEIVRGYEYQKGMYVVVEDEDLDNLPPSISKSIDILDFVRLDQVDPVFFDRTYYLQAISGGDKAYTLLVEAMKKTGRIALAQVTIRSKQTLAAIRPSDNLLLMETMFYPDEIRAPVGLTPAISVEQIHDNEMKMAVNLIENLAVDFAPQKYVNEHRQALWTMIEKKVAGQEVTYTPTPAAASNVVDLMEALKASVKLAEENRKGTAVKTKKPRKKAVP